MDDRSIEVTAIIALDGDTEGFATTFEDYQRGLRATGRRFEILLLVVGDGARALASLCIGTGNAQPVRVIRLNRRFDDSTLFNIGIEHASGNTILLLTPYHQIAGSSIPALIDALETHDVVLAARRRRDSGFNRLQARVYSYLVSSIADLRIPDAGCDVKAMRRRVAEEVPVYGDMYRFLPLLAHRAGFCVGTVEVDQAQRDLHRRVHPPGIYARRVLDLLTAFFIIKFTRKPLRFFGLVGLTILLIGAAVTAVIIAQRLFFGIGIADRPALLLSSLMMVLGIQIMAIGLIGEIVIFTHARDMKEYKVDHIVNEIEEPLPISSPESSRRAV